jgi:hypothetical protein
MSQTRYLCATSLSNSLPSTYKIIVPVGFEPTRPKPADLKSAPLDLSGKVLIPPAGLEPATFRLEVECAIQLRQEGDNADNLF